jgi:hypothetical protein
VPARRSMRPAAPSDVTPTAGEVPLPARRLPRSAVPTDVAHATSGVPMPDPRPQCFFFQNLQI